MGASVMKYLSAICRHKLHLLTDVLIIVITFNLLRTFSESYPPFPGLPDVFSGQLNAQNTYRYMIMEQRWYSQGDLISERLQELEDVMGLQDGQQLDLHKAYKIINSSILLGDTFNNRQNLEKLLAVAKYINSEHKIVKSTIKSFTEGLKSDNFYGQKFLVENGMRPEDVVSRAHVMKKNIKFTKHERNELEKVKRTVLHPKTYRRSPYQEVFKGDKLRPWQRFENGITSAELYREESSVVDQLLKDLQTDRITNVTSYNKGSQLKLILTLADGSRALFKPKRFPSQSRIPNSAFLNDLDRHTSEIAAFHLDRAIGFHRATPSVGRVLNITKDIIPFMSKQDKDLIYKSPAGHMCIVGHCRRYCSTKYATCGTADLLQGSLSYFFTSTGDHPVRLYRYDKWPYQPWTTLVEHVFGGMDDLMKTFYNSDKKARRLPSGRVLLDVTDAAIFDFLIDNSDRHYLEYLHHGNTTPLLLDNGKGFGQAFVDTKWILAPMIECLPIRFSTFNRLLNFERGSPKLSDVMRESLSHDLLAPVLLEEHLLALDRRVKIILKAVYGCIVKNGSPKKVVVDDGY